MIKRLIALLLALTLILSLFGCAAQPKEKDAVDEFIDQIMGETRGFVAFNKNRNEMEDPLTICMDLEYVRNPFGGADSDVVLNEFLYTLEESGGLSDVEILFVPKHGEEREIMLENIRDELLSGGGPDVFILNCTGTSNDWDIHEEAPLFDFPEKAMENDFFLPLDEYMEKNTRFAEWDKMTQAVLAAGRNEEGQQIIPLAYTMPLLCFRKADVDIDLTDAVYTWDDMLNNPAISRYARFMADCTFPSPYSGNRAFIEDGITYLEYSFGELADFWDGYLSFTEEELLQRVNDILMLYDELRSGSSPVSADGEKNIDYYCTWLGSDMVNGYIAVQYDIQPDKPLTMLPLYSDDGGATASILSWAAVNRNTDRPEDAYTVIDMLTRSYVQKNYRLYENYICENTCGIPMHEDILRPDMPFGSGHRWSLTEENYNEWCEVRSQITSANFQSAIGVELSALLEECIRGSSGELGYEYFVSVEQSVHEAYERIENMLYE